MNKKKILFDAILISVLLIGAVTAALVINATRGSGSTVAVSQNGKPIAEYDLSADGEYSLADGGNILVIEGGEAYIRSADCPDGLCVAIGRISMAGERIVCLPNKIIVEILE